MKNHFFLPIFLCLISFSAFGCRAVEPEEVYLISALGFDRTNSGVRVSAEVPLTREDEADKMEVRVFEGEGETFPSALEAMKAGLAKQLEFGHCALIVFGDGMENSRLDEILECLFEWQVPLSATVVYSPNAGELLKKGSLSAPAVGYEIPDILRLISKERGILFQCRVYEVASSGGSFRIPQFLPNGEEAAEVDRLEGECVYHEKKAVGIE
ncbi:MAG: hypothetical protein E7680_01225 [Ruminococcaceae bacterium]|nr:hypothetical protein [Oscillospiraceae bacterium]